MAPEKWQQLKELFAHASALPQDAQQDYLQRECGGDEEILREVQSLLAASSGSVTLFPTREGPEELPISAFASVRIATESAGTQIGPYKLVRELGEGGFGSVWLAEQKQPVSRQVALKIIKLGMDTKQVVARFEAERQALAIMDHPNIARVIDGGATDTGRPYFVMELVKGIPITEYCDQSNLTVRQRMELLVPVCQAVQHAHQKGIIHRDIKPSNVLIAMQDGKPVAKVIDFGIAKAINQQLTEKTVFTQENQMIGTPAYMSPEQASTSALDIDTRSDIYSLGVLTYELLTGATPFTAQQLRKAAYGEIQRMIRDDEPPKPSTRLSTIDELQNVAALRKVEPSKLTQSVRGELDWIVMKCLEKDRTRRYETANGLAADIQRYLNDDPVQASPPSNTYRLKKLIRRNKGAFATAAAFALVLTAATIISLRQAKIAREQRAEAEKQKGVAVANAEKQAKAREQTEGLFRFVVESLRSSDPESGGKRGATIADAMQNAIKKIESGAFNGQRATEASLKLIIAQILKNNGDAAHAEPLARDALAIRERMYPGDDSTVSEALQTLASSLIDLGRNSEAEPLSRRALEMNQQLHPGDHHTVTNSLNQLGRVLKELGRYKEAEAIYQQSLEMSLRMTPGDSSGTAAALTNLGGLRYQLGQNAEAERLYRESLEMTQRITPGDNPETARLMTNLSTVLWRQGKAAASVKIQRRALEMHQRIFKGDHPLIAKSMNGLAVSLGDLEQTAEAESYCREALEMRRRLYKGDHPLVASSLNNLGANLHGQGRFTEAEAAAREALEMYQRLYKGDHTDIAWAMNNLAAMLGGGGKSAESEPYYRGAMDMRRRLYPGDHPDVAESLNNVANLLLAEGRAAESEPLFREALEMEQRIDKGDSSNVALSLRNLAVARKDMGRLTDAEQFFRQARDIYRKLYAADHPMNAVADLDVGDILNKQSKYAEAEPFVHDALASRERTIKQESPGYWRVHYARSLLGESLAGQGKFAEAGPLLLHSFEALRSDPNLPKPTKSVDRVRDALARVLRLYEYWDKSEPGKGYDLKAAEWKAKLEALQPPASAPTSAPATAPATTHPPPTSGTS